MLSIGFEFLTKTMGWFYFWIISKRVDLKEMFKGSRGQGPPWTPCRRSRVFVRGPFLPTNSEKNHIFQDCLCRLTFIAIHYKNDNK